MQSTNQKKYDCLAVFHWNISNWSIRWIGWNFIRNSDWFCHCICHWFWICNSVDGDYCSIYYNVYCNDCFWIISCNKSIEIRSCGSVEIWVDLKAKTQSFTQSSLRKLCDLILNWTPYHSIISVNIFFQFDIFET